MGGNKRISLLNTFADFLNQQFDWQFNKDSFDDRFLLQKYVFLAQRLGYPSDYGYNVYVFGAYSPALAQDYYNEDLSIAPSERQIQDQFDAETFERIVKDRDARWLELASTIILLHDRYPYLDEEQRREKVIEKTQQEKNATRKSVEQILRNLEEFDLVG